MDSDLDQAVSSLNFFFNASLILFLSFRGPCLTLTPLTLTPTLIFKHLWTYPLSVYCPSYSFPLGHVYHWSSYWNVWLSSRLAEIWNSATTHGHLTFHYAWTKSSIQLYISSRGSGSNYRIMKEKGLHYILGEMSSIVLTHQRQLDHLNRSKTYLSALVRTGIEEARSPFGDGGSQFIRWI